MFKYIQSLVAVSGWKELHEAFKPDLPEDRTSFLNHNDIGQVLGTDDAVVFTQTEGQSNWLMNSNGTSCDPSYPVKGKHAIFTVEGTW